jgi:polysaccharide export outer membrane protein
MNYRRGLSFACGALCCLSLLLPGLAGCAMLNSFLDPTAVGQFPAEYKERGIRRILTPRDSPPGLPNASEPTPQDLVPVYEDYRLGPGDVLGLAVYDLVATGQPEQSQLEISPSGNLRVPQLGSVKVSGLTEQELEEELKARYREAQILANPDVRLTTLMRRGRMFIVRGSVGRAGQYPIGDPDTRLLDAIGQVQDIGANVQRLYVIRRTQPAKGAKEAAPFEEAPGNEGLVIPPPEEQDFQSSFSAVRGLARQEPPASRPEEPKLEKRDLEEVLAPGQATRPTTRRPGQETEPPFPPLILDSQTGKPLERERAPAPTEPARPVPGAPQERVEPPFEWEAVPELELEQRVIEIDVRALFAGDPRYNIVVRDRDVINVPIDTGVFYLMGEVNRPGVYGFNGRDITIKQALSLTGGMTPLGWPQRCEIIRHEPGTDKQLTIPVNLDAVFAGLEDDIFLRDDDIFNVGTHVVAPFLFVIRNSFRFTYGFGFVYDRNFADQDAYGAKLNPEIVEQQKRQARGLPF